MGLFGMAEYQQKKGYNYNICTYYVILYQKYLNTTKNNIWTKDPGYLRLALTNYCYPCLYAAHQPKNCGD